MIVRYGVPFGDPLVPFTPKEPPSKSASQTAIELFEAAVAGSKPADLAVRLATLLNKIETLEVKSNAK